MIGKTISHYEILKKIGKGGMGVVYKAKDKKLNRLVALKFLPKDLTSNQEARERFIREAQSAAALNNTNIVTIHEINEYEGHSYIVMEYIEGETLSDKMNPTSNLSPASPTHKTHKIIPEVPEETPPQTQPLDMEEIINISVQVCQGLRAAHKLGIVHRDIKPQNIIMNKDGEVKILDFGVAKLKRGTKITKDFSAVGTVYYMSSEQLTWEEVDQRTDIWSLGVVLYEMVTMNLPFKGNYEQATMYSILNEDPIPPSVLNDTIPGELEKIILKCLRKRREERYPSVEPLMVDLDKLMKSLKKKSSPEIRSKRKIEISKEKERRHATVISADIFGYHELLEQLDAEEAASIISSCFEKLATVIEKYGGQINKIMGGSLTGLFGAPIAIENAPQKAVGAAIEMRNQLLLFNQENNLPISLDVAVGINSGMVIAGTIGDQKIKDYTVMGETVILASQLKNLAGKGQIYVGPLIHKNTRDYFNYKKLKPITLKGQSKTIAVFELLSAREKTYHPDFGSGRIIHSRMVGRDKELDKLRLHVLKVIDGEGSIINIIGEAGIGKSRLISELKKTEDLKKVTLLEGCAVSMGRHLSYHPIIDILKNWVKIEEKDTEAESLSKLETAIKNVYPENVSEIFPFIATMMGMKLRGNHALRVKGITGEGLENLILKSVRELILKSADRRAIVFIIEDLHWSDLSSIELLESLFYLVENHRILFINVFRPNFKETGERILETLRNRYCQFHTQIHLEALGRKQCEILINNLMNVSGLPPEISNTITSRTEGNPFYIEEVVHSFIDEGVLEHKEGKLKVTGKIDSVEIPETIQDLLMARIDRLDERTKTLLKEASVIGRYFFHKILIQVAKDTQNINGRLEYLKGVQFIKERMRLEEIEYFFKHALVQEVAHESILMKRRKELHLQVAATIESVFSERLHEFYGMLALHYNKGENLEKAEEYLIKAGEEAQKAAASNEALAYYQEALKLYLKKFADAADPEKVAQLEKNIGLAFYNKGHMSEALTYLDRVLEYNGVRRVKSKVVALFGLIANLLSVLKNLYFPSKRTKRIPRKNDIEIIHLIEKRAGAFSQVDPKRFFMESIGIMRRLNNHDITKVEDGVTIYSTCSTLFSVTGISFNISRKILDYTKKYIDQRDLSTAFRYAYLELLLNVCSGEWTGELGYNEALVNHRIKTGDVFYVSSYIQWNGFLSIGQGNFKGLDELLKKLDEIGKTYGHELSIGRMYAVRAKSLLSQRKLHEAQKIIESGIVFFNQINMKSYILFVSGMKPYAHILLKEIQEAEESLIQTRELFSPKERILPFALSNFYLSQFLFDLYRLEESIMHDSKTNLSNLKKNAFISGKSAIKNSMKFAPNKPEVFRSMGLYYWLTGRQKEALKWWDKSINIGNYLGARPELARTFMELGKRLLEEKSKLRLWQGIEAEEYLNKARVIFEEMELNYDLQELEKIGI